jgi:hypothetical protein
MNMMKDLWIRIGLGLRHPRIADIEETIYQTTYIYARENIEISNLTRAAPYH